MTAVLYSDVFTAVNGSAPAADWAISTDGVGALVDIQSNSLHYHLPAIGSYATLAKAILSPSYKATATEIKFRYTHPGTAVENYFVIYGRSSGAWTGSAPAASMTTGVGLQIEKDGLVIVEFVGGTQAAIGSPLFVGTYFVAGHTYDVVIRILGSTISVWLWDTAGTVLNPDVDAPSISRTTNVTSLGQVQIVQVGGAAATVVDTYMDNFVFTDMTNTSTKSSCRGMARGMMRGM